MFAFFKKYFWDFRFTLLTYSSIILVYELMLISMFPSIKEQASNFEQMLEAFPEAIVKLFGVTITSMSTIEGFLAIEYFSMVWIIILSIFVFTLGANIIAGEIDKGSSDFSFTLPIKREDLLFGKFLSALFMVFALVTFTVLSCLALIYAFGESTSTSGFFDFWLVASAMSFFLLAFITLLSAIFSNKAFVYAIGSGFLIFSYLLHVLSVMTDKFDQFYPLSFFKYYGNPQELLMGGGIDLQNIFIFLIVSTVLLALSFVIVEKRDL